jgi:GNAT superfamily N-acetyltransferase
MTSSLKQCELSIEPEPTPDDIRRLEDNIYAFNVDATGISDGKLFGIFLRDDARVAVGGAFGWTWAGTCGVRMLFVPIHLRNKGHGTRLMRAVEAEAQARGMPADCAANLQFPGPPVLFQARKRLDRPGQDEEP